MNESPSRGRSWTGSEEDEIFLRKLALDQINDDSVGSIELRSRRGDEKMHIDGRLLTRSSGFFARMRDKSKQLFHKNAILIAPADFRAFSYMYALLRETYDPELHSLNENVAAHIFARFPVR
jgi:hypothetical protein